MNNNSLLEYNKLFNKLEKLNKEENNELAHILQDKIYRKFIRDIVNKKIKGKEIEILAKDMNKYVVKKDIRRWYA
jgi:hypothetical protein